VFAAVGDMTRAGRWLRWTTITSYDQGPAGLPGNDDSGTMSAFYVFASLGLYPVPGTDLYALGSPLMPHAVLTPPAGPITIDAPAASTLARYPQAITLNGNAVTSFVHHGDLANGTLQFEMSQ
jgi:putative alpha-1,2-mannosidase